MVRAVCLKSSAMSESQRSLTRAEHQKGAHACQKRSIFKKPMHKFKGKGAFCINKMI